MTIITIQTLVLLSAVFFLGCATGCWFARRSRPATQDSKPAATASGRKPGKRTRSPRRKKSK